MEKLFYIFLFIISVISCTNKKQNLIGSWKFTEIKNTSNSLEIPQSTFNSNLVLSSNGNFLLFDDGIIIHSNLSDSLFNANNNETSIYYGNYSLNDNESVITLHVLNYNVNDEFQFKLKSNDGKNILLQPINYKDKLLKYTCQDYNDTNQSKFNYLSSDLNNWRIKSKQKESNNAIKIRVKSAIEFSINYLKYHKDNGTEAYISFLQPLPFKFASNGIAFKREHENWDNIFFDTSDAEKANTLLLNSFKSTARIPDNLRNKPLDTNLYILKEVLKNLN